MAPATPLQKAAACIHAAERAITNNQPFAAAAMTRQALAHLEAVCDAEIDREAAG